MAKLNNTTIGNNVYSALKLTLYKHVANNYEKLNNKIKTTLIKTTYVRRLWDIN